MATTFDNEAAWIVKAKAKPFEVRPGPTPAPADDEVVIKVAYAAVNPTDFMNQDSPYFEFAYPWIFGTDVSGTIVQLGSGVTRFKIGQRVIGHCDSLLTKKVTNSAFQRYTTCKEILVAAVPDSLPLANAAVLPLAYSTAASGLYCQLGLPFPSLNPVPTGKTILIWGGSSACGSNAIQLAKASGYNVISTASVANFDYVKSLGASEVFDRSDPNTEAALLKALKPGDAILDCIATKETQELCSRVLAHIGGGKLPTLLWPLENLADNVTGVIVNGLEPGLAAPEVGDAVWRKYLPEALAAGKHQAKPESLLVKGGLEKVQEGVDLLRSGMSAKKVVVEISGE